MMKMNQRSTIIPCLSYDDAKAAITFLCDAFGFEKKVVFEDESGIVVHAQLTFGGGMIMISDSSRKSEYSKLVKQPEALGGFQSQSPFIFIKEGLDLHYEKAKAAGAKIALELKKEEHGSGYSCFDPEGHLWNFGDFDPWAN